MGEGREEGIDAELSGVEVLVGDMSVSVSASVSPPISLSSNLQSYYVFIDNLHLMHRI